MVSYTVTRVGPPSTPAQPEPDTPGAAEDREATAAFESWIDWIGDVRSAIEAGGGDSEDPDALLATVLQYVADESKAAIALAETRSAKFANDVLRRADDSNAKIAVVLRQQRVTREAKEVEALALAGRLDRIAGEVAAVTRENSALKARLAAQETEIARATAMLEREISKERALRRLLDAQRTRPHTQRVASELAKRLAKKALEVATKTEAA